MMVAKTATKEKKLHEGDYFEYNGYGFELVFWDPIEPTDMEYGVACIDFSESYAPDLDLIIGFIPQGATEKDVMKVIRDNFWKVQERIDINDQYDRLEPHYADEVFYRCGWCDRAVSNHEILVIKDGMMEGACCPFCGKPGPFTKEGPPYNSMAKKPFPKHPSKCTKPMVKSIPKKPTTKKAPSKDLKSSVGKRPMRKAPAKKVTPRRK